jgi:transcriptional regulator with XRE-family HTH domain
MNRVREYRERTGLSQQKLARLVAVPASNLSDVELHKREAWPLLRRRLARALKVPESELFPPTEGGNNGR